MRIGSTIDPMYRKHIVSERKYPIFEVVTPFGVNIDLQVYEYLALGKSPSHWIFIVEGYGEKLLCSASIYMVIPPRAGIFFSWPWGPGVRRRFSSCPTTLSIVGNATWQTSNPRHLCGPYPKWTYSFMSLSRRTSSGSGNALASWLAAT